MSDSLKELTERARAFVTARDWNKFQSPKNLVMCMTGEMGEVAEHFQWLTQDESRNMDDAKKDRVAAELADVLIYMVRVADEMGIDLVEAAHRKQDRNETRFDPEKVMSRAPKET